MSQRTRMRALFESRQGEWIPLPEVKKGIAQYNARILELRAEGMYIQNKTKPVNGEKWSWFRYDPQGQKTF